MKNILRGILWATIVFIPLLLIQYILDYNIEFLSGWICGLVYIYGSRQFKETDYK